MRFFRLVERKTPGDESSPIEASMQAVIRPKERKRLNRRLAEAKASEALTDGAQVVLLGKIAHYAPSGSTQFEVADIDTEALRARRLMRRDDTVCRLRDDGLLNANKRHRVPLAPMRVTLVTSQGQAAHHDVARVLADSGRCFDVTVRHTLVQGPHAPRSIAEALAAASGDDCDVVLLCRGGGSSTDLSAFDEPEVARAVAECRHPVIAGIGHEIDRSAADEAAHTSCATPTAAAAWLVEAVAEAARRVDVAAVRLTEAVAKDAAKHRTGIAAAAARLDDARSSAFGRARRSLRHADDRRGPATAACLADARRRLRHACDTLEAHDPANLLARGWALMLDSDGRQLRSAADAGTGDTLTVILNDGRLAVEVVNVASRSPLDAAVR